MLHFPGVFKTQFVSQFNLLERILNQFVFAELVPVTGQLVFVKNPKFHLCSPITKILTFRIGR